VSVARIVDVLHNVSFCEVD